jgi:hypothetical protein
MAMKHSVSKVWTDRLDEAQLSVPNEKNGSNEPRRPQSIADVYQKILTRELLIGDLQDSHFKYY